MVLDFAKKDGDVTHIIIKFDNEDAGKALRQLQSNSNITLCANENGTPLPRLSFSYNISKKQLQESKKAIVIQFPLQLGFAMTIHKIQGATVPPPKSITSDFSKIFDSSQVYTVLSRIKQLDQLFLINDVYKHKIYTSRKALKALKELENKAINSNCIGRREDQIKIV